MRKEINHAEQQVNQTNTTKSTKQNKQMNNCWQKKSTKQTKSTKQQSRMKQPYTYNNEPRTAHQTKQMTQAKNKHWRINNNTTWAANKNNMNHEQNNMNHEQN